MPEIRLVILAVTYLLIAVQQVPRLRLNRPAASLLGATAMVTIGGLPLREAYAAIDLDVVVFLLGVLILTGYLELGGFFEWAAAHVVRRTRSARALLGAVVVVSGVLSALFVNDTVCLALTPLLIVAVRSVGLPALPFLLAVALASNVGSAATLTGNPQNMLVGVASGISYARFAASMLLPAAGGLAIVWAVLAVVHRRELARPLEAAAAPPETPFDRALVTRSLIVFAGALAGWLAGLSLPLVAIAAGAVMLLVGQRDPAEAFAKVEWSLLLFFCALFVVMRGVRDLPLLQALDAAAIGAMSGEPLRDATIVSAVMTALSNLVSNVPAVILWTPVVPRLHDADFVWLVIAMSSTFAGNLTLLGSMANLIVAERAEARGERIGFVAHLRVGVPVTLLTLAWGVVVLVMQR
jgi:Na+/H+ antiporter NhaD/arsenite permease-like protein